MFSPTILLLLPLLPLASAWGAAGHEITATIAEMHLHPLVKAQLCSILPPEAKCHLAPVAAWADQVRGRYPDSGGMHYVNPNNDNPSDHCEFGESGWANDKVNVLTAIMNKTQQVIDGVGKEKDIPLRFLIHFLADLHQPLHLTGRDRGGNSAMFRFEGRSRNLHSVWDSGIITKNIRELSNYTTPTTSRRIESALTGAIFDPYVRFIVSEGIWGWWANDSLSWAVCPEGGDPYPMNQPSSLGAFKENVKELVVGGVKNSLEWMGMLAPSSVTGLEEATMKSLAREEPFLPVCPYHWATTLHPLNCDIVWPANWVPGWPYLELDTDEYLGRVGREKTVERLLAMGGIRMAAVLNSVLLGKVGDEMVGPYWG